MPEGDTIFRTARTLEKVLSGQAVTSFRSSLPALSAAQIVAHRVTRVEARGKNLLIHFDDDRVLYTHMRMTGSWHVYRPGERWHKPERQARVVITTAKFVAVCLNAPVVELLSQRQVAAHPALRRLGPDLLKDDFDLAEARRRLRDRDDLSVGEALMLQSVTAGIGNVFKSETMFLCAVNPFLRVRDLDAVGLDRVLLKARELMSANLRGFHRTTRFAAGSRYWVYGRRGEPCFKCGAKIQMRRQGLGARSTYWCPVCQPASTVV